MKDKSRRRAKVRMELVDHHTVVETPMNTTLPAPSAAMQEAWEGLKEAVLTSGIEFGSCVTMALAAVEKAEKGAGREEEGK